MKKFVMFEFIKNFFSNLFKKNKSLLPEPEISFQENFEKEKNVNAYQNGTFRKSIEKNYKVNAEQDSNNKEDFDTSIKINDDTDIFDYMNKIMENCDNYNNLVKASQELEEEKRKFKNLINKVRKSNV